MRLVVAAALLALGCGKRDDKPITCADAARAGVDVMLNGATDERAKQHEVLAPRLRAEFTRRCVDGDWRADAIVCFAKVKSMDDLRACKAKLAPEQQAMLPGEDLELELAVEPTQPTAPAGSAVQAPSQPPSDETVKLQEDLRALDTKLGHATNQAAAASSPAEREAAQAIVKELQTQKELLDKQLSGSREQELQKQMDQLNEQLGSANAQP